MTRRERLGNDAESTLTSVVIPGDLILNIQNTVDFPAEGNFRVVVDNEIMIVTSLTGSTFTVTRGAEGTVAANHIGGSQIAQILTVGGLNTLQYESNDPFAGLRAPYRTMDTNGDLLTHLDFTQINPGSTTFNTDINGNIVAEVVTAASLDLRILARSAPSTPYTIKAAMIMNTSTIGILGPSYGIGFRESSTSKITVVANRPREGTNLNVWNLDDESTFNADVFTARRWPLGAARIIWFEIEDDNVNLKFRYSIDGINFSEIGTIGRTSFMAGGPDQVIWWVDQTDAGHNQFAHLLAWDGE